MVQASRQGLKENKKRNLIVRFLFWLNILCAFLLLLSYLAPFISPETFWPLAFLGLAYYYLLIANLAFFVLWLIIRRRNALLSLVIILLGINNLVHLFSFRLEPEKIPESDSTLKVLSYNVRLFDLYRWSQNKQTRNRIFSFLKKEAADVLCLQEFYDSKKHFPVYDTLVGILGSDGVHVEYTLELKDQQFGIATFSKHPIVNKGFIDFHEKTNNSCIYSDILKNGDTIRIYNLHLQSNTLNEEDIRFIEAIGTDKEVDELEGSGKIFRKLKSGFIKRAAQADLVAEHIRNCPYPVIVCGDLNDSPFSYTYNRISGDLYDAFEESGTGFGKTYAGKMPSFRIDYILFSSGFRSLEFQTIPEELSDHYPVMAILKRSR